MEIGYILQKKQPKVYDQLNTPKKKHNKNLTEEDIKELMSTRSYRRKKGGAIRQVR